MGVHPPKPAGGTADRRSATSLDNEDTSARKLSATLKRKRRCFHRVLSGLERGGYIRFLTLTSSPQSPPDIHHSFRILVKRLERRKLLQGYIQVPELTKKGYCHKHILFRGSYIAQALLSRWWKEIHNAEIIDIRAFIPVRGNKAMAGYMAKYMTKEGVKRYSWSWGWVWRGFVKDWKALYRWWAAHCPHSHFGIMLWIWRSWLRQGKPDLLIWRIADLSPPLRSGTPA